MLTTDLFLLEKELTQELDRALYLVALDRMRYADFKTADSILRFCQSCRCVHFPKTTSIASVSRVLDMSLTDEQKAVIKADKLTVPVACELATSALCAIVQKIAETSGDYHLELSRIGWLIPLLENCALLNTMCQFDVFTSSAVYSLLDMVQSRGEQLQRWIEEKEQKKAAEEAAKVELENAKFAAKAAAVATTVIEQMEKTK